MTTPLGGIHHVSAIATDAQRTLDFYTTFLGLRLVKKTVNFDDPNALHLYFGDHRGHPGTLMTFFPLPRASRGRRGTGQVAQVSLAVPEPAIGFWVERFTTANVAYAFGSRFGERTLDFEDPDGLALSLVGTESTDTLATSSDGPVSPEQAIRGIHGATLWVDEATPTASLLTRRLGFQTAGTEDQTTRFTHPSGGPGLHVDVRETAGFWPGAMGGGVVHHIAFRATTDEAQERLRAELVTDGLHPTDVIDRKYFHSVYFREPNHVLFEIATDLPGFEVDEDLNELGTHLALPAEYEAMRDAIEHAVPSLQAHHTREAQEAGEEAWAFVHRVVHKSGAARVLLALHGTGGDENDLIPLAEALDPTATILSPRGRIREGPLLRFFARYPDGTFDQDSLTRETHDLANFVRQSQARYGLKGLPMIALGYSNGANIAASLLLRNPGLLDGAILLRPMLPFEPEEVPDLTDMPVLLSSGIEDTTTPRHAFDALEHTLWKAHADISIHRTNAGHELTDSDIEAARAWLANLRTST